MTNKIAANDEDLQHAMRDVLAIRQAITAFRNTDRSPFSETRFRTNRSVQMIALFFLLVLIGIELLGNQGITRNLLATASHPLKPVLVIGALGSFLALCLSLLYAVISRAAAEAQETIDAYIKRHFAYLQNMSQISDVLIKFIVISAVIFAKKPEWVSPFLFLFTGDYLVQNRFFTLDLRATQIASFISFLAGLAFFYFQLSSVLWPMLWFLALLCLSLRHLHALRRKSV